MTLQLRDFSLKANHTKKGRTGSLVELSKNYKDLRNVKIQG